MLKRKIVVDRERERCESGCLNKRERETGWVNKRKRDTN